MKKRIRPVSRCKSKVSQRHGRVRPSVAPHVDSKNAALLDIGSEDAIAFELDPLQIEILEVMYQARIPEELVYAYLRTGLMVTEENYNYIAPEDRHAWQRAISEYDRLHKPIA
ncbi:MAG TPA: hypothetical protein VMH28_03060 [Candidatus Acidoferrales bacterium]|nr:hypothetical protein [Candidatus Acidoferrales bacterium]